MKRTYMPHRKAYFPRLWPVVLAVAPLTVMIGLLVSSPIASLAIGCAVGSIAMNVRLAIWRRRHPRISPEQWLNDMRRAAPFN